MGAALMDLPMPAWMGARSQPVAEQPAGQEFSAPASNEMLEAAKEPADAALGAAPAPEAAAMPQGAAAAEMAAASKPRRRDSMAGSALPAPLVPAGPSASLAAEGASFITPLLPEPPALDAPLARAGVILPEPRVDDAPPADDSIWDVLALKRLPIPGLGSVQAANAATADMPVPQAPAQRSPFAPAEQAMPGGGVALPGAPPLPANIPSAVGPDGAPLPLREGGNYSGNGALMPLPQSNAGFAAPAPNIPQRQSALDHNAKSQELARQQQDMLMLRQQMDQRLKDLQTAEDKMKTMLQEARDVEDKKVKSLVQMYANMKPRTAAQALENMDERVAVRILNGMAPKQSGEILTYTNPAKTAKFTEMITRLRMGE